ncbi:AEC family transporter [Thermophilibacter immobilis]|jgi:predicted permease|uniref:AEC family transporter n=1 Tax=Thermophilibacter immobilis TaxID=2779519 RepID=A0A7S7M7D1_9ACTN|nr:AEC family transporter [Thermophilibacter immobilis]QOY60126.1 hypothetical protein INP52_06820 [Thermophilibacter immobilis]
MLDVIVKVLSFVVIIFVGVGAARSSAFGDSAGRLVSRIVFNLTLPAAIVRAFQTTELEPALLGLIVLGFLANALPFFFSLIVYRKKPREERVIQQANVSGLNIGCFALSFVQAFFPVSGVVATCLFDAGNSLMSTGGTWALMRAVVLDADDTSTHERMGVFARTLFSSVPFDCYLVLIALGLGEVRLPPQFITLIDPIASANSFLSLFMIGLMIRFSLDGRKAVELVRLLGWRFAFATVLSLATVFVLPLDAGVRQVVAVLAWAPAASTGPLYTLWAGGDEGLAGMANALTVLVGIVVMTSLVLVMGV